MHPVKLKVAPLNKRMFRCFSRAQAQAALQAGDVAAVKAAVASVKQYHSRPDTPETDDKVRAPSSSSEAVETGEVHAASTPTTESATSSLTSQAVLGVRRQKQRAAKAPNTSKSHR
jgi:hypothetical protein